MEISLLNKTRNEIDVHYGRNKDCLQKIRSFIHVFKCVSGKIAGKIRLSVHESELLAKFVKTWSGFTGREVHVNASQNCVASYGKTDLPRVTWS